MVGLVHPASGRALFHLATTVFIPLCEVELAAFARQVDAGPRKHANRSSACWIARAGNLPV